MLLLLVPGLSRAEPDNQTDPAADEAVPIDPASRSDIPVAVEPGRGDKAVSDMKREGVATSAMIREMISSGYTAPDLAASLRIYDITTPDAAASALTKAGFNPVQVAAF